VEYLIHDLASLEKLQMDKSLKQSIRRIKIDLGRDLDFKTYERQLNQNYFACGCKTGSLVVALTLAPGFILWLLDQDSSIWVWWKVVLVVVAAAFAGKIIGLGLARIKLRRLFGELRTLVTAL
jgi:hypothetical protein